ncbi:MAG: type II toxin-antitoxin system VapC family toxin [Acidobacteria bacterium]|nr:type II toxin-antitoxin system VapC family toxin [Acidobacteriota bacterium]
MSDLLLDTQAMLWFFWDDPNLSSTAKTEIENPNNRKLVSIASCWEAAIKAGLKKLELGAPCAMFLNKEISRNNFELLHISFDHATMVETLPSHHRDPFDRLLVAQALVEGLPIVSSDSVFDEYGIKRLW